MTEAPAPARLEALTSLRFFAALAVFFHHYGVPAGLSVRLHTMAEAGYCGVTLFFVLSGFVLTHNYFGAFRLRSYAVARVARVYPLYLFVLLWCAAPALVGGAPTPALWQHVLALQAWSPSLDVAYAYNSPGWSLSVELFLYARLPLLLLPLRRIDRNPTALLVAAGGIALLMAVAALWFSVGPSRELPWADPGSAHRWLYRSPAARLGDFALGMVTARLYARLAARPGVARAALALAAAGALAIAGLMGWPRHLYTAPSFDVSYALPAAALLLGLALSGESSWLRWLRSPALVRLGEGSYALYLIQMPFLDWTRSLESAVTSAAGYGVATALSVAMLCALSLGLHEAIERPAQRALRTWLAPRSAG